ncbi:MAG TPA: hypothetical protein VFX20_08215, partial [Steroidobacteraceae bacterium]|nr:hypothetical protein [Steroidobacteraceae bacterium]
GRTLPDTGRNPMSGAIMDFFLAKDGPVRIEILDSSGKVVRTLSSEAHKGPQSHTKGGYTLQDADRPIIPIGVKTGMNRIAWDLHLAALPASIPGVYLRRAARGRFVTPGSYTIRLTAAGQVLSAPLEILGDPRSKASAEDFAAQDRLLVLIEADMTSLRETVLKLISVHDQIASVVAKLSDPAAIRAGKSLADQLEAAKDAIVQHGIKRREIAPPNLLYDDLNTFHEGVNTPGASLDASKSDMYPVLHEEWLGHKRAIDTLLGPQLDAFDKRLSRSGLPPIVAASR